MQVVPEVVQLASISPETKHSLPRILPIHVCIVCLTVLRIAPRLREIYHSDFEYYGLCLNYVKCVSVVLNGMGGTLC